MDSKASGVTAASRKQYRAVLPRQTDLMQCTLHLQSMAKPAESVWYLVQDAVDAYWQVRLHPQERKYYCAMLRRPGKKPTFLAYNRTAGPAHLDHPVWAHLPLGLFHPALSRHPGLAEDGGLCG